MTQLVERGRGKRILEREAKVFLTDVEVEWVQIKCLFCSSLSIQQGLYREESIEYVKK